MGDQRPGDNLYTASVLALDSNTGEMKGYHQYLWNESWDWDEVDPPILVDFERDGRTVKGLVHAGRNGYIWVLERSNGAIKFVYAKPFVKNEVIKNVDPKTGRPEYAQGKKPATGVTVDFCPSLWGGKDWPAMAYSPQTRLLYIPANENLCSKMTGERVTYTPGQRFTGATSSLYVQPGADHIGELQAWNLSQRVTEHRCQSDCKLDRPPISLTPMVAADRNTRVIVSGCHACSACP